MQNGHNKGEKQKQNILRSGGKNTQNCTKKKKKNINDTDKCDGGFINIEPVILECEIK